MRHSHGTSWNARCRTYSARSAARMIRTKRTMPGNALTPACVHGPSEGVVREMGRHDQEHADRQVIDSEISKVQPPTFPQRRLFGADSREDPFQQNPSRASEEQVE